jgi:hypothetical protein
MEDSYKSLGSLVSKQMDEMEKRYSSQPRSNAVEPLEVSQSALAPAQAASHKFFNKLDQGLSSGERPSESMAGFDQRLIATASPFEDISDLNLSKAEHEELSRTFSLDIIEYSVLAWRKSGKVGRAYYYLKSVCKSRVEQLLLETQKRPVISLKQQIDLLSSPKPVSPRRSSSSSSLDDDDQPQRAHGQRAENCPRPEMRYLCPYQQHRFTIDYMASDEYKWHTREGYRHRGLYKDRWEWMLKYCEENVMLAMQEGIPNPYLKEMPF